MVPFVSAAGDLCSENTRTAEGTFDRSVPSFQPSLISITVQVASVLTQRSAAFKYLGQMRPKEAFERICG